MNKPNTKGEIVEAALDLFSVYGYGATSISQIAEKVGIKKASLYSHFSSKQDILANLIDFVEKEYEERSLFSTVDWSDTAFVSSMVDGITPEKMVAQVKGQINYIVNDSHLKRVRKMLVIEQFQNEELSKIQGEHNYTNVLSFYTNYMKTLISAGVLRSFDPEIMAAQFASPITIWISVLDREPDRQEEIMEMLERHIRQFLDVYKV